MEDIFLPWILAQMFQVIYKLMALKEKKCDKVKHNYQTRVLSENKGYQKTKAKGWINPT